MCKIYVSTYAKYNQGNLNGQWVDLENYTDLESFLEACHELHKDESEPEFMFQDFEGFPKAFYSEYSLDERVFEYVTLADSDKDIWEAYLEGVDSTAEFKEAQDKFYGYFESDTDLAYEYLESTGLLEEAYHMIDNAENSDIPENLQRYFDYEAFGRDLAYNFYHHNGYYFSTY